LKTLRAVMLHWAHQHPDKPLLLSPETKRELTYGELLEQTASLAIDLQDRGIRPGAHIGLYLQNGLQTSRLFLSVMAAGYVVTPFNLLSTQDQLTWVLDHSDCELVFFGPAQREMYERARACARRTFDSIEIDTDAKTVAHGKQLTRAQSAQALSEGLDPSDPALLMYTSGTTGNPKGVRLTHQNLVQAAQSVSQWHALTPDDRVLSSLPIYHINGQSIGTITPFYSGGSIVCAQKFSVSRWWPAVAAFRCTWINMVPTILAYLLNASDESDAPSAESLRHVRFGRSASAPLPPEQHREFEERFGILVIEAMGMTESASVAFCNPHDDRRRYGSPGLPCGVAAKVIDAHGKGLKTSEVGEICLTGSNVMTSYYKSPSETERAFDAEGWLRTGDLGFRDEDGFYFITGRLKELIIKGGENIAPREIDEVLLQHPAVLDAACVGVPDPNYGQEILACLVLKEGKACSLDQIRSFCLEKLGKYKTPKEFHFVQNLPRGPSGKVQRLKLLEWGHRHGGF